MTDDIDEIDFALAAWREDGQWQATSLPPRTATTLDSLLHALRQVPADAGSVGMVSVADEFFVIVRVLGDNVRLLISDIGAALDYSLADDVLHHLEIPLPEDEDDIIPGGDIRILDEFGIGGDEIELICDDDDLYPDQALAAFARRIGFGDQFDAVLESLPR